MNIDEILDEMDELLDKAHAVPFAAHKAMIDGERLRELISDVRLNIPQEIKRAKLIDYDCKRIMKEAEAKAEGVVRRAEERAKALVSQEAIVKEARKSAEDMLLKAKSKSNEIKKAVNGYVDSRMTELESYYADGLQEVKRKKAQLNLNKSKDPLPIEITDNPYADACGFFLFSTKIIVAIDVILCYNRKREANQMLFIYMAMLDSEDEKETFAQIYNTYSQPMYQIAYAVLQDVQEAEDAVQISFEKIILHIDKFLDTPCSKMRSLIVIIVRNTAVDLMRKRRSIPMDFEDEAVQTALDLTACDEDRMNREMLVHAIGQLKEKYASALELKYWHGFTEREIAAFLNISAKAANSRLVRGRVMLRKLLEQEANQIDK